jgi:integrase/recombinase XerD
MKDKKKALNYNALYRKQHWFALAIKRQMYRRLEHVKEMRRQENRRREDYHKKYYQEHKEYWKAKSAEWVKNNPERRKQILKRYSEKLTRRRKRKNMKSKIERVIQEFLDYCKQRYDKETARHYRNNLNRFHNYIVSHQTRCSEYHSLHYQEMQKPENERDFNWVKEYQRIQYAEQIDRDFITRYVGYVNHDEINPSTKRPLNQSEKESRLYPMKAFLWFCLRKGYLSKDLRKFIIVPPRERKTLKRVLTQDEMARYLDVPDIGEPLGIRDKAILELSYSGLRSEEILGLKLKHLDVVTNTVTILDGKGNKDRVVPMTSEAVYWMKCWLDKRPQFAGKDSEYIFISKRAKPINRRNFATMVKKYAKKAGIDLEVSPHDLRRTTATHLVENGAPIRLVQALLGHATLKVTTKYLRLSDERIKKEHKDTHPSNRRSLYYGKMEESLHRPSA